MCEGLGPGGAGPVRAGRNGGRAACAGAATECAGRESRSSEYSRMHYVAVNSGCERERALVSNGKLTVPLFHGTSTLFYQSILETGLGARSIVEDLKLRSINQC